MRDGIVGIEHAHRAAVGTQDADEHADRGRLAGTVLTEDAVDGAARNVERQIVDRDDVGERLADVVQRDRGLDQSVVVLGDTGELLRRGVHSGSGASIPRTACRRRVRALAS